jgi:flagellar basal body-associated protein FliL
MFMFAILIVLAAVAGTGLAIWLGSKEQDVL